MYERHGYRGTPTYNSWINMKVRCSGKSSNVRDRANYYERGIAVCSRWRDSFPAFLQDMGERPAGMTLDRIDPDGDYCRENCRWAAVREQLRNTRRTRMLEHAGRCQCLQAWADEIGIRAITIARRIDHLGWSVEKALTTPVGATRSGTVHNQRSVQYRGETTNLKALAVQYGINYHTLRQRVLRYGWSLEKALNTPARR